MSLLEEKQALLHKEVTYFEDAPCYPLEEILKLQAAHRELMFEQNETKIKEGMAKVSKIMDGLQPLKDAPKRVYLWKEDNVPSTGAYTENPGLRFNHDPDFLPYMLELLVSEDVTPKGAVVVCAGGDHGDCTLHEGYQTCRDLNALGYQSFLLLNRTNHCPYAPQEAGADASRAIRMVRANAKKYRVDENKVAFAGFSNGGLTAEACIQYFSGTQRMVQHFPKYREDELDAYYGAPDAVLCVYGPRFKGAGFDYTNVVYPPTFFAVGREDSAMDNLNATLPDLMAHHVEVEVHTFAGVPHGQSGVTIYGGNPYPHFQLWVPLADAFLQSVFAKSIIKHRPDELSDGKRRYDAFANEEVLLGKKKNHLPAMGWNSWNAFGSGNTEALTKDMADLMVELELDKLGYEYIVLDDGCYKPTRVEVRLSNEERKFPSGFKALSDYIHSKGLKFGMYNDIGTNLCAGAFVGTCGHEALDAQSYVDWGVDFLKVDNCYYLWDNATFSKPTNAKYVYAPNIAGIRLLGGETEITLNALTDGVLTGNGAKKTETCVTGLGTFDGTGPWGSPARTQSGELEFTVSVDQAGEYELFATYATGEEPECGSWLQVAIGRGEQSVLAYDDFVKGTPSREEFAENSICKISLCAGDNVIRLMNHRRQENTLSSYASLLEGLNIADPNHDIIFSICEWGKTQPQNWGYKVGDSWRILNDITFAVGSDGNPGGAKWVDGYTPSITSQYDKAVIMDEYAGLTKGWNDPDMLVVGMNGINMEQNRTHMAMWCMMNAPLMLGMDLRRIKKGDDYYKIIANKELIALNQDALGIQAKRVYARTFDTVTETGEMIPGVVSETPDTDYIRNHERVDILAKPLSDGSVAISFINLSETVTCENLEISAASICSYLKEKMVGADKFAGAKYYIIKDLWTNQETMNMNGTFMVAKLGPCDNVTIRVTPKVIA